MHLPKQVLVNQYLGLGVSGWGDEVLVKQVDHVAAHVRHLLLNLCQKLLDQPLGFLRCMCRCVWLGTLHTYIHIDIDMCIRMHVYYMVCIAGSAP